MDTQDSSEDEFDRYEEGSQVISQWAQSVIDYSESYGSDSSISYSAVNICGRPSKYPAYGDFAECYSCRKYGPSTEKEFSSNNSSSSTFHDFIVIKYENFVLPKEIRIYETYNPGSVVRIYAYCISKQWQLIYSCAPGPVEKRARELVIKPLDNLSKSSPTRSVKKTFLWLHSS
jgi:F-box and leucine-rich repeat protein 4